MPRLLQDRVADEQLPAERLEREDGGERDQGRERERFERRERDGSRHPEEVIQDAGRHGFPCAEPHRERGTRDKRHPPGREDDAREKDGREKDADTVSA